MGPSISLFWFIIFLLILSDQNLWPTRRKLQKILVIYKRDALTMNVPYGSFHLSALFFHFQISLMCHSRGAILSFNFVITTFCDQIRKSIFIERKCNELYQLTVYAPSSAVQIITLTVPLNFPGSDDIIVLNLTFCL